eukprot:6198516-Pleurochrysis_carterae.AAC.3
MKKKRTKRSCQRGIEEFCEAVVRSHLLSRVHSPAETLTRECESESTALKCAHLHKSDCGRRCFCCLAHAPGCARAPSPKCERDVTQEWRASSHKRARARKHVFSKEKRPLSAVSKERGPL